MSGTDNKNEEDPSIRRTLERSYDWITKRENLIVLWARASSWDIEEGIALAFNTSPEKVIRYPTGGYDRPRVNVPEPGSHYLKLARRAVTDGALLHPIKPTEFISWAESVGLGFDAAWHDAVSNPNSNLDRTSPIDLVLSEADQEEYSAQAISDDMHPKARTSLLKLVIGMAVGGYGFDPNDVRSDSTKEISDDLELHGVALKRDTILKWLREAAELLPQDDPDRENER